MNELTNGHADNIMPPLAGHNVISLAET